MPSSIGDVKADTERRFSMEQTDDLIVAGIAGEKGIAARLTSLAGLTAVSAKPQGETVELPTSGLPTGVYVLTVEGESGSAISKRVIVR